MLHCPRPHHIGDLYFLESLLNENGISIHSLLIVKKSQSVRRSKQTAPFSTKMVIMITRTLQRPEAIIHYHFQECHQAVANFGRSTPLILCMRTWEVVIKVGMSTPLMRGIC